jgi:hypothetical protein
MATSDEPATDLDRVQPVVEMADLVADREDADPEAVLQAAKAKIRRRGDDDQ